MSSSRDRTADKSLSTRCMPTAEPWRVSEQSLQFFISISNVQLIMKYKRIRYHESTWKERKKKKKNNRSFFYFYKSKIDIFKAESKNLSFNLIIFITKQFVAVI